MKKLACIIACLTFVACESNDNDDSGSGSMSSTSSMSSMSSSSMMSSSSESSTAAEMVYTVELVNATAHQPLSPPLVGIHTAGETLWQIGEPASAALELMAESGNAADLAVSDPLSWMVGEAVILPGTSAMFELAVPEQSDAALSVATMLVNTNDAFTGVTNMHLAELAVGETKTMLAPIYDAGTEANDEAQANVPGPAAGGEGYNSERNDVDRVSYHPGVVSAQDGLSSSALDATHKFDQGAVTIKIYRRQ